MSKVPRYTRMSVSFKLPIPLDQLEQDMSKSFQSIDFDSLTPSVYGLEYYICDCMNLVACVHFQFPCVEPVERWIDYGVRIAMHFFWGDWGLDEEEGFRGMADGRKRRLKGLFWYRAYHKGLILALLSERWDDVARLAEWPWASLMPEYSGMGDDLEDEVAQMYIIIAASLRTKKLRGVDKLIEKVRKCRAKRPRLLMKCWNAVLEKDQAEFDKAMAASLKHHATIQFDPRDGRIAERLALPQTAICLAAMRLGLEFPDLPEELSDWIITRNSIGLE